MRILIVQDNEIQARAARGSLKRHGLDVECVQTLEQAMHRLEEPGVDAVLLDLSLPDSWGIDTFFAIRSLTDHIPIVIFTGPEDQEVAFLALKHGAQDFLIDGQEREDTIVRCLRYAIERSNADNALRTSEKRQRLILQRCHDGFISMDSTWHIKDWNVQAEKMFGLAREEVLGQPLFVIVPPRFRHRFIRGVRSFFKVNQQEPAYMIDERMAMHQDGHEFPIEIVIFQILEDINYSYCAFAEDITERKQMAQEMEKKIQERTEKLSESMEELKQFAKIASHDLQEPLRAIQGFAKLLAENLHSKLDKENQEFLEYIIDGTNRMQHLIQSILLHSKINTEQLEPVATGCNSVIDEVLANLRESLKESSAEFEIGDLPEVAVERWQLIELFQNLIGNAIKYRSNKPPKIDIAAEPCANNWLFSVRDNGIGIDPKYTNTIFDMFARLHDEAEYSGTGMGLAICKKVVTSHSGKIWVESQPGTGSIFLFTLPRTTGEIPRRSAMDKDIIQILLVEDHLADVRLTQEALKRSSFRYKLDVAGDGVKAMEYLNQRKNSKDQLPDVILLDLNMPRKTGHEVLAEIKEDPLLKHIAVALLTVSRRDEDVMEAFKLGMNYYLAKPIESSTLSALIRSITELQSEAVEPGHSHTDEETHIRLVLAGNPHTPVSVLSKLASDENPHVRARVAENPELPEYLLAQLAGDRNEEVRLSVSENAQASVSLLERLSKDASEDVRLSIAGNPRMPLHILSSLQEDENVFVASIANETIHKLAS